MASSSSAATAAPAGDSLVPDVWNTEIGTWQNDLYYATAPKANLQLPPPPPPLPSSDIWSEGIGQWEVPRPKHRQAKSRNNCAWSMGSSFGFDPRTSEGSFLHSLLSMRLFTNSGTAFGPGQGRLTRYNPDKVVTDHLLESGILTLKPVKPAKPGTGNPAGSSDLDPLPLNYRLPLTYSSPSQFLHAHLPLFFYNLWAVIAQRKSTVGFLPYQIPSSSGTAHLSTTFCSFTLNELSLETALTFCSSTIRNFEEVSQQVNRLKTRVEEKEVEEKVEEEVFTSLNLQCRFLENEFLRRGETYMLDSWLVILESKYS